MASATANQDLAVKLLTSATQAQRILEIPNDSDFVFNFLNATKAIGDDGFLVLANDAAFPALLTGNGGMALGFLGPCGLNSPHTHPRATEIQLNIGGGDIHTAFLQENGARVVQNTVSPGMATIFPKGSMHFQQSLSCEPVTFVASFDSVDFGALTIAQSFFSFDKQITNATLGSLGVQVLDNLNLPKNIVLGAQECLDRCGIDRSTFNFSATFADYISSTNSSWKMTTPLSLAPSKATGKPSSALLASDGSSSIPFSDNPLRPAVIGLSAASGVLFIALILVSIMAISARSRSRRSSKAIPSFGTEARGYPYVTPYDDNEVFSSRKSTDKA
ncbi:RmlC-like cupin domain-containing protein [Hysterangium stoloniferum]|nr:RmlC-like cupin domain-containing protein [Hysterangium stoloniferum]